MKLGYDLKNITSSFNSEALNVLGAENILIEIVGSGGASGNVKIAGSVGEAPNFANAKGLGNSYDFLQTVDLQDGASISGDTGITFSGDDVRLIEVNVNALRYLGIIINHTGGRFDVKVLGI